jgi:hypothetical protein
MYTAASVAASVTRPVVASATAPVPNQAIWKVAFAAPCSGMLARGEASSPHRPAIRITSASAANDLQHEREGQRESRVADGEQNRQFQDERDCQVQVAQGMHQVCAGVGQASRAASREVSSRSKERSMSWGMPKPPPISRLTKPCSALRSMRVASTASSPSM